MTIESTLADMGFVLYADLVRDDFDGREGSATWAVTVTRNGQSIQTEYPAGCADRHYPGGKPIQLDWYDRSILNIERNKQTKPDKPQLADVLSYLVSDAQSVAEGQTFEDWAGDLDYDIDSREAERVYNGCRVEYFGLLRLCGHTELEKLVELFQDY